MEKNIENMDFSGNRKKKEECFEMETKNKNKKTVIMLAVIGIAIDPCIAAVASVKRELGNKWAVIMVVNQCAVAWLCALLVRLAAVVLF